MKLFVTSSLLLASIGLATAETLYNALASRPEAKQFLASWIDITDELVRSQPSNQQFTILIPTDAAFAKLVPSLANDTALQRTYARYHVLESALTSSNFSAQGGLTVPTQLEDSRYNNRSAGPELTAIFGAEAKGQVLYISKTSGAGSSNKFRVRTRQLSGSTTIRSGLSSVAALTAVDGVWDRGTYQFIDTVLQPPAPCSDTIRQLKDLSALDNALNRTDFWMTVNHTPNFTCLAPTNSAFKAAGDADSKLSAQELTAAIKFHAIGQPLYSNFLKDGAVFTSLANLTIRVSVNSSGIWFNDAKVIEQNVLTNNGLIHVLDKVMTPLEGQNISTSQPTNGSDSARVKPSSAAGQGVSLYHSVAAAFVAFVLSVL